jgi:sigma-E factor negative regulatory protein RseA
MSNETREHLSSLMDGEISRDTSRFLVRRLGSDKDLCATWARYHVVRDCLRDPDGGYAREDLCARVREAIEREAAPAPSRRIGRGWLKPVAGVAIAASVALVAVMAVEPGPGPTLPGPTTGVAAADTAEPFVSPQGRSNSTVATRAASARSLDRYLLRHYQATGAGNARTFSGFVPVLVAQPVVGPAAATVDDETAQPAEEAASDGQR